MNSEKDVIIIGSGIAGYSAAIYAARGDNEPLVVKGDEPGGQLTLTMDVANYPGFPDGISGSELVAQMEAQAVQFGADTVNGIVDTVENVPEGFTVTLTNGSEYASDSVIVASGASARNLGIPGEGELMGYGVSTCATCDGAFFRGEDMVVVGGGDAACEEAAFLTKFADTVYLVHRRDDLRAEAYWQNKVREHVEKGDIEILWNTEVEQVNGSKDEGVTSVGMVSHSDGHPTNKDRSECNVEQLDVGAMFIAIGHTPNTQFLENTEVELTEEGYIVVDAGIGSGATATNVEGIFAAGDVFDHHYQQAVTAAGSGTKAALDVDQYLSNE
jgi:thioredoxin reductase (NADPH)